MTSHYPVSGDRAFAYTPYTSRPVAVFPDGSVMWEQETGDRDCSSPIQGGDPKMADTSPRMSTGGIVLGVAIALFSTGFGAILPRMVSTPDPRPASCPQTPSPFPVETLSHRTQTLAAVGCNARR